MLKTWSKKLREVHTQNRDSDDGDPVSFQVHVPAPVRSLDNAYVQGKEADKNRNESAQALAVSTGTSLALFASIRPLH